MNTFNLHQALSSVEGLREAFTDCSKSSPFDAIRQLRADGLEFWSARDLQTALGYVEWRKFSDAIERARLAAINAGSNRVEDQFVGAAKLIEHGKGGIRQVHDFHLSRYASYLVAMNGDPHKPEIAAAQHYFAMRTREAEIGAKEQPRESSYMKAFKAGILFAMQLPQREEKADVLCPQPRTNRVQPVPTYHRKGDGLPVKIDPRIPPKMEAARADILSMPTPVTTGEVFAMLREEHGIQRNRENEMAVAYILKGVGSARRKQYRRDGKQVWVYVRE